jgi:hypothetical protein
MFPVTRKGRIPNEEWQSSALSGYRGKRNREVIAISFLGIACPGEDKFQLK